MILDKIECISCRNILAIVDFYENDNNIEVILSCMNKKCTFGFGCDKSYIMEKGIEYKLYRNKLLYDNSSMGNVRKCTNKEIDEPVFTIGCGYCGNELTKLDGDLIKSTYSCINKKCIYGFGHILKYKYLGNKEKSKDNYYLRAYSSTPLRNLYYNHNNGNVNKI